MRAKARLTVGIAGWRTAWVAGALVVSAAACGDNKGGGGTTAEAACVGTPVACGLLSALQCASAAGCATGACSGTVASCEGFTTSTECLLQQGCAPSGGAACGGVALSCLALSADAECRAQRGCSWQQGCSGRAPACGSLNATACLTQPGCHLGTSSTSDGGTSPDTSPPPQDCEDAGVPAALVIDDMEDQTQGVLGSVAYGSWYVYDDETTGAHMTPAPRTDFTMEPIPGGRCASEYAMRMSGSGFAQWGAGMGFDFGYGDTTVNGQPLKIPADTRTYTGVRFWARVGQATSTHAVFSIGAGTCPPPDAGASDGGDVSSTRAPSDCALGYPKNLVLTTDWARYDIRFDELVSNPGRLPLPRDQIYSFQFLVAPATTFDLWIDDISWLP